MSKFETKFNFNWTRDLQIVLPLRGEPILFFPAKCHGSIRLDNISGVGL